MNPWFALTTKPRHERAAAGGLERQGFAVFVPLYWARRRWSDRLKQLELCLFPGYVFCRFSFDDRLQVLAQPGVVAVIGFGGKPTPVPDNEIAAVEAIIASGLPAQPWPYLRVGQKVRIEGGPLSGLEGLLAKVRDAWRVVVSIELLQRSLAVEIDRELIAPAPTHWRAAGA